MRLKLRFVIGSALIVGAIAYLIVTAIRSTSEYYLTVNEVAARQGELGGQSVRVAGSGQARNHRLGPRVAHPQIRDRAHSRAGRRWRGGIR